MQAARWHRRIVARPNAPVVCNQVWVDEAKFADHVQRGCERCADRHTGDEMLPFEPTGRRPSSVLQPVPPLFSCKSIVIIHESDVHMMQLFVGRTTT